MRARRRSILLDTLFVFLYFLGSIFFMELVYHGFSFGNIFSVFLYPLLLTIPVAGVLLVLTGFFKRTVNNVIMKVIMIIIYLIFAAQFVYMKIFDQPLMLAAAQTQGADALATYWREALNGIFRSLPALILFAIPVVALWFLLSGRVLVARKRPLIFQGTLFLTSILFSFLLILVMMLGGKSDGTIYANYRDFIDPKGAIEQMGVMTATRLDLKFSIFKKDSSKNISDLTMPSTSASDSTSTSDSASDSSQPEIPTVDTSPNVMDIDFDKLIANESNDTIKTMHEYFKNSTPSKKNEYTGMFEGYNLIYMCAESFSPYCISEEVTPTLYKLTHSGFVFDNFYTPLWQTSTSDGEFVACTGLLPDQQFSFRRSSTIDLPFTLAKQFNRLGCYSRAYHNNSLTYYERNQTHPNLGYDFKAANLGKLTQAEGGDQIFEMEHPTQWPQSDLEMIQSTVKDYVHDQQFHAYYMTVSGHMNYSFSGNAMSSKNREAVSHLNLSEAAQAYIACNVEFDKALADLIEQLDAAGQLEKTVICFSADHYPYGLEDEQINELAGETVDKNFDIYRNKLVLWNSEMDPITIDKPCGSVDIIPTLSNLFGFEFDSRLLLGRDILSDSEPLVVLSNRSFITDKVKYNSKTQEATFLTDEVLSDEELERLKKIVKDKFTLTAGILDNDYYSTLRDELKFTELPPNSKVNTNPPAAGGNSTPGNDTQGDAGALE